MLIGGSGIKAGEFAILETGQDHLEFLPSASWRKGLVIFPPQIGGDEPDRIHLNIGNFAGCDSAILQQLAEHGRGVTIDYLLHHGN